VYTQNLVAHALQMAASVDTKCMATGARHEVRMILLGRTGTGTKSTELIYRHTFYSLFKAKVHLEIQY